MARPIKETPVLTGRDARNFEQQIQENAKNKVPDTDYQKALKDFHSVKVVTRKA